MPHGGRCTSRNPGRAAWAHASRDANESIRALEEERDWYRAKVERVEALHEVWTDQMNEHPLSQIVYGTVSIQLRAALDGEGKKP